VPLQHGHEQGGGVHPIEEIQHPVHLLLDFRGARGADAAQEQIHARLHEHARHRVPGGQGLVLPPLPPALDDAQTASG